MEYLTIKLRAQDLYSVIVNLGCALVNHNKQKSRENNLKFKYKSSELYLNPLHGDTLKTPRWLSVGQEAHTATLLTIYH